MSWKLAVLAVATLLLGACSREAGGDEPAVAEPPAVVAAQPQAAPVAAAATDQCRSPERVIYTCAIERKVVSVCADAATIAYRYGPPGAPEIEIASNGKDGKTYLGRIVGGGGGEQTSLRFLRGDHSYLVFSAVAGSLTEVPGRQWSGVAIHRGDTQIAQLDCPLQGDGQAMNHTDMPPFVPEEADERFLAWF